MTASAMSTWSGRRVLVTGAAGLLGTRTADDLGAAGAQVIGFDRAWKSAPVERDDRYSMLHGDVRDQSAVQHVLGEERIDTVIHLAAQTLVGVAVADPVDTFEHNVAGTWSVLEACRRSGRIESVVVASSDKAYGDAGGRPYDERMPLRASAPYDVSKATADLIAQSYAHTFAMPVVVSRCANLYGAHDLNWSRIVPGTIRSIAGGERPEIRSDGSPVRDYLYVGDASRGLLRLAEAVVERPELRGEAFNFSAGQPRSVLEIVRQILDLMGSQLQPLIRDDARHEIPSQAVSAEKARRELGWSPQVDLDTGLATTIAWYRAYLTEHAS